MLIFAADKYEEEEGDVPNIFVRANDSDVFTIMLYHARYIGAGFWMDIGLSSSNTRRLLDVNAISHQLGPTICTALPAFHAFTGSDCTSSFMRRGKTRPYDLMVKNDKFLKPFQRLGSDALVPDDVSTALESYVKLKLCMK